MNPVQVLIAPDSFKGSTTAEDAARAIAAGWRSVRPDDHLDLAPMADGGEGTLDAFAASPGAARMPLVVPGPAGAPHDAAWVLLPDGTGVVELAACCGLPLLDRPAPLTASTRGLGVAIRAAVDAGVARLVVGLGGSASTDGGVGALQELGARLLDVTGAPVGDGGGALAGLAEIDLDGLVPPPPGGVRVLTDVRSPLTGPDGAAAVFGPQKGADADDVQVLDLGLEHLARLLGGEPEAPGAGAAGGAGYGLARWGGVLEPGAKAIAALLGLRERAAGADLVITGEGRFDAQTEAGKTVSAVLRAAAGTAVALVAGRIEAQTDAFAAAVALIDLAGDRDPITSVLPLLQEAGARLARAASSR